MRISDWSSDVCSSDLVAPETIARAVESGDIDRIARGLYQLHDAPIDTDQGLAEIAKRIPNGVIAMVSTLAFHGLTDQMPRRVWVAIGHSEWDQGIDHHTILTLSPTHTTRHQGVKI